MINNTTNGANGKHQELSEKERAVIDIVSTFKTRKGAIDWKAAWAARPDYQALLRYDSGDDKNQQAYNIAFALRRRGIIPDSPMSKKAGRKKRSKMSQNGTHEMAVVHVPEGKRKPGRPSTRSTVINIPSPGVSNNPNLVTENELDAMIEARAQDRVVQILGEVGFCPRCGKEIKPHQLLELKGRH